MQLKCYFWHVTKQSTLLRTDNVSCHFASFVATFGTTQVVVMTTCVAANEDRVCNITALHGDVIKWTHFPRHWPFVRGIHRSPVNSPHKGQWRGALMFSLICARINGWVNNREAGDLRRHRAHCDVIIMQFHIWWDILHKCCTWEWTVKSHLRGKLRFLQQPSPTNPEGIHGFEPGFALTCNRNFMKAPFMPLVVLCVTKHGAGRWSRTVQFIWIATLLGHHMHCNIMVQYIM